MEQAARSLETAQLEAPDSEHSALEVPEVSETLEVSETPEVSETSEVLEISEVLETSEVLDTEALKTAVQQPQYFWQVKPDAIVRWGSAHKLELALTAGMGCMTLAVSGVAMSILLSPSLGQTITYDPLIDEATLAASRRTSLGDQLLDQVARVLEIEIIETQGPTVGHRSRPVPTMTIVAQADKAAPMPEADLAVGLKTMLMAAGVGLGVTGLIRLLPLLPPLPSLGKQRRQPLAQRLKTAQLGDIHPLAPGDASRRPSRAIQTLVPGALTSLAVASAGDPLRQSTNLEMAGAPAANRSLERRPTRRGWRRKRGSRSLATPPSANLALSPVSSSPVSSSPVPSSPALGSPAPQPATVAGHSSSMSAHRPALGELGKPQLSSRSSHRPMGFVAFSPLTATSITPGLSKEAAVRPVLLPPCHG